MVLADFEDYCRAQRDADMQYRNKAEWNKKAIINVAESHIFAADRSVLDYNDRIWHLTKLFQD